MFNPAVDWEIMAVVISVFAVLFGLIFALIDEKEFL